MNHKKNLEAPINLGNPDEFSINELAEIVIDLTGSKSNIVNKPLPQDDPIQRKPDISFAKENLLLIEPIRKLRIDNDLSESTVIIFLNGLIL